MAKAYHPSYTKVNPAKDAWMYTSETVYWRKVTMLYDWLPSDRVVESWFRRVPWRLERDEKSDSWIVKYFEFRAGIGPLPQLGYVGDLWISWNARDPSVWFKVDEMDWERWKGCASSLRERMDAKHPFLDGAYLWFSPRDFFFTDKLPNKKLSLQWDRLSRIRKLAPTRRIIDPDASTPPKKIPVNPIDLPSMQTIVRTLCPNMVKPKPKSPTLPPSVDGLRDDHNEAAVASTSGVQVGGSCGPYVMEEIVIGNDVEINWDWWGSTDGEAEDESTGIGGTQSQFLVPTPTPPPVTPPPITPSRNSRYHPYRSTLPPATPYSKFRPPTRYTKGTPGQNTSTNNPRNTPASVSASTSTTVINPSTPTPRLTSEPTNLVFADDREVVGRPRGPGEPLRPKKLSRQTLEGIARILREDGHDRSGVWALPLPEIHDSGGDLAAELPVPALEVGHKTLQKIRCLLRQDGFVHGILVLKMHGSGGDQEACYKYDEIEDIWARI